MKTRIISALAALLLLAGVLYVGGYYPVVVTVFLAALAVVAVFEALKTTGLVKNRVLLAAAAIYAAAAPFVYEYGSKIGVDSLHMNVLFGVATVIITLFCYKNTEPLEMCAAFCLPVFTTFALSTLAMLINKGLIYFLLTCAFAWGCDTGAYFTGVFFGKHKMAPVLSPKKTWEGAVGGVVIATGIAVAIGAIYNSAVPSVHAKLWLIAVITPFFAVLGMMGDLIASFIKRKTGIKDYGKIMPGHGGVLDRFDSIMLIAPCFWSLSRIIDIVK